MAWKKSAVSSSGRLFAGTVRFTAGHEAETGWRTRSRQERRFDGDKSLSKDLAHLNGSSRVPRLTPFPVVILMRTASPRASAFWGSARSGSSSNTA